MRMMRNLALSMIALLLLAMTATFAQEACHPLAIGLYADDEATICEGDAIQYTYLEIHVFLWHGHFGMREEELE